MIEIKCSQKERIPEAIMSIWDDHYVPEDELFNHEEIANAKGVKERMLKALNERDTATISAMLKNEHEANFWVDFAICAACYASLDSNRDYHDKCMYLGTVILYSLPAPEDYSPYEEYDASDYYPPESDWPLACLGDLECPEENWPDN